MSTGTAMHLESDAGSSCETLPIDRSKATLHSVESQQQFSKNYSGIANVAEATTTKPCLSQVADVDHFSWAAETMQTRCRSASG